MTVAVGLLRRIVSRYSPSPPAVSGFGERVQALEQEAARRRLLDQARGAQHHRRRAGMPRCRWSGASRTTNTSWRPS